jgi:hypothetical protein
VIASAWSSAPVRTATDSAARSVTTVKLGIRRLRRSSSNSRPRRQQRRDRVARIEHEASKGSRRRGVPPGRPRAPVGQGCPRRRSPTGPPAQPSPGQRRETAMPGRRPAAIPVRRGPGTSPPRPARRQGPHARRPRNRPRASSTASVAAGTAMPRRDAGRYRGPANQLLTVRTSTANSAPRCVCKSSVLCQTAYPKRQRV